MKSNQHTGTREELIAHIATRLEKLGFIRTDDNFVCEFEQTSPGGVMIVNGQHIKSPDTTDHIKIEIELLGQGSVESEDGSTEDLETIMLTTKINKTEQSISWGIYYNEPQEFDNYLQQYLRL